MPHPLLSRLATIGPDGGDIAAVTGKVFEPLGRAGPKQARRLVEHGIAACKTRHSGVDRKQAA